MPKSLSHKRPKPRPNFAEELPATGLSLAKHHDQLEAEIVSVLAAIRGIPRVFVEQLVTDGDSIELGAVRESALPALRAAIQKANKPRARKTKGGDVA